jgi:sec-independent protein translocase protein TatA
MIGTGMFDIGLQELVVIFVIALLVFGPKNLPQLGRSLGRAMREFRRASDEFRSTIETNLQINEPDPVPTSHYNPVSSEPAPAPVAGEGGIQTEPILDSSAAASPDAESVVPIGEPYVAQRGAKLFHSRDCGWVKRMAEAERQYFKRVADAKDAGLMGCPVCEPWEPA